MQKQFYKENLMFKLYTLVPTEDGKDFKILSGECVPIMYKQGTWMFLEDGTRVFRNALEIFVDRKYAEEERLERLKNGTRNTNRRTT